MCVTCHSNPFAFPCQAKGHEEGSADDQELDEHLDGSPPDSDDSDDDEEEDGAKSEVDSDEDPGLKGTLSGKKTSMRAGSSKAATASASSKPGGKTGCSRCGKGPKDLPANMLSEQHSDLSSSCLDFWCGPINGK